MIEAAINVREHIRHGLIPAVPIPFRADGSIDWDAQDRYATYMASQPIEGAAVWVHTGRGLMLSEADRERVLISWRRALSGKILIAGAGGAKNAASDKGYTESACAMGEHALSLGADALLCYAPVRFRDRQDRDQQIISHHSSLAEIGLPLMLFYLYEAAGGITYSRQVLTSLLALPQVFGIKMATLDSVMTYQEVAVLMQDHPDRLLVTGEDRFLGYSLMRGGEAALIGMGSAYCSLQKQMMKSFYDKDFVRFQQLSHVVDRLAECTFIHPMEGYIGRMLYILARLDIIPIGSAFDPWGPAVTSSEKEMIDRLMIDLSEYAH